MRLLTAGVLALGLVALPGHTALAQGQGLPQCGLNAAQAAMPALQEADGGGRGCHPGRGRRPGRPLVINLRLQRHGGRSRPPSASPRLESVMRGFVVLVLIAGLSSVWAGPAHADDSTDPCEAWA